MICEKCQKKEAKVKLVKVIEGKKEFFMLCNECANKMAEVVLKSEMDDLDNFDFNKVLNGLVEYMNKTSEEKSSLKEFICPVCGMTYDEFKDQGILGCESCFEVFEERIIPIVNRYHGSKFHGGNRCFSYIREGLVKNLEYLKRELEDAIKFEDYEKAAGIRDEIRLVKNSKGGE
ncbi:MAG: UvrB/UvrC motif-containing protein [Sarcina sp.]